MTLITFTAVIVDGVMQGLGVANEDRSAGFERGGPVTDVFDDRSGAFLNGMHSEVA